MFVNCTTPVVYLDIFELTCAYIYSDIRMSTHTLTHTHTHKHAHAQMHVYTAPAHTESKELRYI